MYAHAPENSVFAFLFAAVLMLVAGLYSQDALLIGVAVLFALMAWLVGMEAKKTAE